MQILYDYSEEDDQKCLSIIKGKVKKFNDSGLAVPQMGWNKVNFNKDHNFLDGYYYFANSYYAEDLNIQLVNQIMVYRLVLL